MALYVKDLPELNKMALEKQRILGEGLNQRDQSNRDSALRQLLLGQQGKQESDMAIQKANLDVQKQAGINKVNQDSLKQVAESAPEGATVHAGDLSYGVDPMAKLAAGQVKGGATAISQAQKQYMSALPKLQDSFGAASEGLKLTNDPRNIGSLGQARTLMLKSMGMNRYNEQEAKAVLPPALQGTMANIFNQAGGDETPMSDSQRRTVNSFFQEAAKSVHEKHDMLKQNVLNGYQMSPYADPSKASAMQQSLGAPFEQNYSTKMKQFEGLPTTATPPEQRPAPQGLTDTLRSYLMGGAKQPQPAPAQSAPPMSFEDFKKAKAAGTIQ